MPVSDHSLSLPTLHKRCVTSCLHDVTRSELFVSWDDTTWGIFFPDRFIVLLSHFTEERDVRGNETAPDMCSS